jgi:hypothetical protein
MMGAEVAIPHHTSLVKRAQKLEVSIEVPSNSRGPVSVVVASSGLKVYGEGEESASTWSFQSSYLAEDSSGS